MTDLLDALLDLSQLEHESVEAKGSVFSVESAFNFVAGDCNQALAHVEAELGSDVILSLITV